jgi:hypothetical protein
MPPHAPTHLIADYVIEKATADLYEPLLSFLTVYACINVATVYVTTGAARCQLGDYGSLSDQSHCRFSTRQAGLFPRVTSISVSDAPVSESSRGGSEF